MDHLHLGNADCTVEGLNVKRLGFSVVLWHRHGHNRPVTFVDDASLADVLEVFGIHDNNLTEILYACWKMVSVKYEFLKCFVNPFKSIVLIGLLIYLTYVSTFVKEKLTTGIAVLVSVDVEMYHRVGQLLSAISVLHCSVIVELQWHEVARTQMLLHGDIGLEGHNLSNCFLNINDGEVVHVDPPAWREPHIVSLIILHRFENWRDLDGVTNHEGVLDLGVGIVKGWVVVEHWIEASSSRLRCFEEAFVHESSKFISLSDGVHGPDVVFFG